MHLPTFTVLMVEDLVADRELYRRALRQDLSCGYDLLEVESVAAGLALCQTRSIDAVLLDYVLPDGNGLDFLERLAVQNSGSKPPVVMISGHGNEQTAVRAIKLGANDYLVKNDLTTELLLAAIRSAILQGRGYANENTRDVFGGEQLTRVYNVQAAKLDDGFVASWREIAAQKQLEISLTDANRQIMTIWESMTDAYVILDRDWRFTYANSAANQVIHQLTERWPTEFLGKTRRLIYGSGHDITDRKIAELNERFLYELIQRLRLLTDAETIQWETVKSLGEYLNVDRAAWFEVDEARRLARISRDWDRDGVDSIVGEYPLDEFLSPVFQAAMFAGEPMAISDVTADPLTAAYIDNYSNPK